MHEFPVIKGTPLAIRYPPKKERMSPKKEEHFKRKGIVFQPLFFKGDLLIFGGINSLHSPQKKDAFSLST